MHQTTDNFLEAVAKSLYQIHGQNIADLTIVFPNRRSGLFFTEYLNRIISGPTFSPEIITIQELFSNISNLRIEEQLLLIFRLYKIYRNLSSSQESFDEFYLWGEMLLHDFDQVDKYLVDAELLFTNITDLKEIDQHFMDWNDERKGELKQFWSSQVSGNQKYDQKEFSQLWQILYPVYQKLREELLKEQIAYEGMLFRDAIENNECINSAYLSDKKFVIAGFNALNGCEKELFKLLKNRQMITFYWDYDVYYLNDLNQEAALFMRENLLSFPQTAANFETDNFKKGKKVRIYHTPSQIGQAQMAAKEISRSGPMTSEFDDTAIVLCDEELLLPVLTSIPPHVETINVTMGLPLRQTPLFSLIGHLISLQKKGKKEGENYFFHYNSIIEILNNQFIQTLYPIECKSIVNEIVSKNKIFVSESELNVAPIFGRIFSGQHEVSALADYFLSILYELFQLWEGITGKNYTSNYLEYIFQVYLSLNKLKNTLFIAGQGIMGSNDFLNRETFFRLLLQYLHSVNITFEGEPLAGLQVMGILETRTLDFKNIVLLSVNEGIMPKSNSSGSFIPYHLRKGNGLPTTEEQNAMYAYYFYRLLQRAESVTFVYNSGSNGLKTGEKSRFIHQLQNESPFVMEDLGVEFSIDPMPVYPISIEKKGKVLETLGMYTDGSKTISPTALDLYLQCPLSFYFKYIAHFNDEEEVTEEVDARIFGQLFHAVMETLYRPYLNQLMDRKTIQSLINDSANIEKALIDAFQIHFFKSGNPTDDYTITGRNKLVFEAIKKMVIQTLHLDNSRTPFSIEGLEKRVEATKAINKGNNSIRIGGIIDRIDSISGNIEILDYKTGGTESTFGELSDLFDHNARKRNKAAFQTLVYCWIYDSLHPNNQSIYPGIFGLKRIFKQEKVRLSKKDSGEFGLNFQEVKTEFEPLLSNLLEEIFNPDLPFFQTSLLEHCQFCSQASLCGKQVSNS
jgi:hypothetical protein